jgi:hypothetical protein
VISSIRIVLFEKVSIHKVFFYIVLDTVSSYITLGREVRIESIR